MKGSGTADDPRVFDGNDGWLSWIAYPDEDMERGSHALATDEGVYVIDPVDAEGIDEAIADLGEVTGVVVALARHKRDSAAVARRHDVPVYLPGWMMGIESDLDAEVEEFEGTLPGSDYRIVPVIRNAFWKEFALFDGSTLVVPEAVGTAAFFRAGKERLGVHPGLRAFPPGSQLGDLSPDRVLVGHGPPLEDDAENALDYALRKSLRNAPAQWTGVLKGMLPV